MDLSTDQKLMGVHSRYATEFGNHTFKFKNTFKETDIKGNNNLFNSLKTEENTNCDHDHDPSSLLQVNYPNEKDLEMDDSLFSYSSFKRAMDLRTHNRTLDGGKRTIFEDAEYFAKNHRYKLLPITFEQVDETVIQSEHNYSLFSLTSESETEENFSRTMDYSQVKEKNYKRRRTKLQEELVECGAFDVEGELGVKSAPPMFVGHLNESSRTEPEQKNSSVCFELENSMTAQPLDLSTPPLVVEKKTEPCLHERANSIAERNARDNDEVAQLDSDKENLNSELSGIRVTITRPDEKENYQPCDLFLNDIARLVPWLIDKDCFEVDILDRTCDRNDELQKHRLYYVISESTWRLFQKTNERVILTNDQSLGQPLRKAEKDEKPSYLVFDQFSLAKCLAEYCQEIGGCFEYTCIEEGKDEGHIKEKEVEEVEEVVKKEKVTENELKEIKQIEVEEIQEKDKVRKSESKEIKPVEEVPQELGSKLESNSEATESTTKEADEKAEEESLEGNQCAEENRTETENAEVLLSEPEDKKVNPESGEETKFSQCEIVQKVNAEVATVEITSNYKAIKKRAKRNQRSVEPPVPKTTPTKTSPRPETSQKNNESVGRKGRRKRAETAVLPAEEPPNKRNKSGEPEDTRIRTRSSGKSMSNVKTGRRSAKKKQNVKVKGQKSRGKRAVESQEGRRTLRSRKEDSGSGKRKGKETKRPKKG